MSKRRSKRNAEQLSSKKSVEQSGQATTKRSSSLDYSSAARPAQKSDIPAELLPLQECKHWLTGLPSQQLCQSKPLQRLQAAMIILHKPTSRQQRQEVQQLLVTWSVIQKAHNCKRKYDEVKKGFITKVIEETSRLKSLNHAFATPCPHGSLNNASACFSAIRASLHHGSIERLPCSIHNSSVAPPADLHIEPS